MRSLERHLLVWVFGALAVGATLLTLTSYMVTLEEMGEVFDDNLRQVALAIVSHRELAPAGADRPKQGSLPPVYDQPGNFDFTTAIRDRTGKILSTSDAGVSLPLVFESGLTLTGAGKGAWHVYTIVSGDRIVQAAQRVSSRKVLAAESASRLLAPLVALIGVIGVLLVVALRRGLRPLGQAADMVAARSAISLEPIDSAGVPSEIRPLIASMNDLMSRLEDAFTVQRRFVADAAHELRSPVTALRLQIQLLRRARDQRAREHYIDELELGIDRAQRLITQLLDLSRVEPDAPLAEHQLVDLAEIVQEAVSRRVIEAEMKGIDLGAEASVPLMVCANLQQLDILLDNLIGNALRYTPAGGRVDVRAGVVDSQPVLQVVDSGPGIAQGERDKVFERFYRGEGARGAVDAAGSGLGLAIVRAIAERNSAQVSLHSPASGVGTEARVVFPKGVPLAEPARH